jgi:hypothetical protein
MDKNSFNSMTFRKELNLTTFRVDNKKKIFKKKSLEKPIYDGEVLKYIQRNKYLKEQISLLSTKNTNIKNFMRRLLNPNKELINKKNIKAYLKEYNELLSFNNKNMKLDVDKDLDNYRKIENNMNNKISNLLITKEDNEKKYFLLENDSQRKDNFIKIYSSSLKNMSTVQESERFRYLNDEIFQSDIDNYYSKYLEIYRKNLLQTTQRWNKFKNKAIKNKKEIEELKKIIRNPKEYKKKLEEEKNINENHVTTTEGDYDIFLLVFDEFEDDFEPDTTEQDQDLILNNDIDNNKDINNKSEISNIKNIIDIEPKYHKINTRNIKRINLNNLDNSRSVNKTNYTKKDLYYFPQNNFSKSILKDKKESPRINSNRTISINSISKLNLKQILFNKNARYLKEEAHDLAEKRFEIENEFEFSNNEFGNKDDIIIKDLKKDIKIFKQKIKKKKKIVIEFKKFCKEFWIKYQRYMNSITNEKEV